eukprot:2730493-Pleurochrysis_carterae.AAC.3
MNKPRLRVRRKMRSRRLTRCRLQQQLGRVWGPNSRPSAVAQHFVERRSRRYDGIAAPFQLRCRRRSLFAHLLKQLSERLCWSRGDEYQQMPPGGFASLLKVEDPQAKRLSFILSAFMKEKYPPAARRIRPTRYVSSRCATYPTEALVLRPAPGAICEPHALQKRLVAAFCKTC